MIHRAKTETKKVNQERIELQKIEKTRGKTKNKIVTLLKFSPKNKQKTKYT
jgi:hypothetical protein